MAQSPSRVTPSETGQRTEEAKKRKLQRWVNCSWPLGRGLGFGVMVGSIRQIIRCEASILVLGTLERKAESVQSGSKSIFQCWDGGTERRQTNPGKGRKSEVGDIII